MTEKRVSVIIPCYNELGNIEQLVGRLDSVAGELKTVHLDYLFMDDNSTDGTFELIRKLSQTNKRIKAIRLSRNFGSHIAISAGIENSACYDAGIVLPSDLQEPPELIPELIKKWEEGNEVVLTIRERRAQSAMGKFFSMTFYKIFIRSSGLKNYPKEGPAAYFLLDKKVCSQWNKFKEGNRNIIGLISWMGFKQTSVYYKQNERSYGKSTWSFMKLLKSAIDTFVSFSYAPIRFITYLGLVISLLGFLYAISLIINKIFFNIGPEGWPSIMVLILVLGGIQLITLGVLGEYIWRGADESRQRPLYLISEKINIEGEG